MTAVGAAVFALVVIVGLAGQQLMHFWWSLLLLGVGWNFLFVGGTALLPASYAPAEQFRAQGANDLVVFGSQAVASLSAGWFLFSFGWNAMMLACVPFILGAFALVVWKTRLDRPAPVPVDARAGPR